MLSARCRVQPCNGLARRCRWELIAAVMAVAAGCHSSSSPSGGQPPIEDPDPDLSLGLDSRPRNLACIAPPLNPAGDAAVDLEPIFTNLSFNQPLGMLQVPGDDSRWFVLEKGGRVRVFDNDPAVAGFDNDFLTLSVNAESEGGLLGMAFHPEYASNGEVFVSWTEGDPMVSVVARFTSADGGATLDPGSRQDVIRVNQPFTNHNGGHIAFGPDGYLYIGFGDGGSGGDPGNRAQTTTNLLGAMLRLDVDGGTPYAIPAGPAGNPFAGGAHCPADHTATWNCPEIYAWGLRNPWRYSFDRDSGVLWAGDVGQGAREEIDIIERGGNYGWNCREGVIAYSNPGPSCGGGADFIEPVHDYPHSDGQSMTGGYVYRGTAIPELEGQYVFGDFVTGRVWRLADDGAGGWTADELAATNFAIASFAEGNDGELFVVDHGGTLHRLVPDAAGAPGGNGPPVPSLLSETGCVLAGDAAQPGPGLIPYDVAARAWFDGAASERWLAIPDGTTIAVDGGDRFVFPPGSVLMERFAVDGALIETRLLMQHADGDWAGYSYEWNADQTDAVLVAGGKRKDIGGQEWVYPSGGECLACHRSAAGHTLGLEIAQLNRDFTYSVTGRTANQLETLDGIGMFVSPIADPEALPSLPDPTDDTAALDDRARAALHARCAHCHGAAGVAGLDLRHTALLEQTGACDAAPQRGDLGIVDARIIAPGDPDRSVLPERMNRRDAEGMPPLATTLVHTEGVALVREWIATLAGCR